jgi:hypothetical protein
MVCSGVRKARCCTSARRKPAQAADAIIDHGKS